MKYNETNRSRGATIHILIVWSHGKKQKNKIFTDIQSCFEVIKVFNIHWDKKRFLENLTVFYAHSQKHLSPDSLQSLMLNKMKHCGTGDFHVVVFKDNSPVYETRETSSGGALVNIRVFEKKQLYRQWTGGGHKVHCSNDAWETNKDLTILLGLNTNDFCQKYGTTCNERSLVEEYISHNCIGVNGYDNIKQFFYVLNNSVKYVVLRNHECLPEQFTVAGHGDIDLLVENKNYIKYLTLAHDVYKIPYRVYHTIRINGEDIPFDFRHVGDNYYDIEWEKNILENREFLPKGFYTPNAQDQFYSLLYHAFIQKPSVADDYIKKLMSYSEKIGIKYSTAKKDEAIKLLDSFLEEMEYEFVRPSDKTVFYNNDSLKISNYANRHGQFVSKNLQDENHPVPFVSVVYEKDDSYYKRGSDFLIDNEIRFLKELKDYDWAPVLLGSGVNKDGKYMETQKIKGDDFNTFFSKTENLTYEHIRSFIKETLSILRTLTEKKIVHRDFIGQNLIIQKKENEYKVYLIDFGWTIYKNEYHACLKPENLGNGHAPQNGISDLYTFSSTLRKRWPKVRYVIDICNQLERNIFQGTDDTQECLQILNKVGYLINKPLKYIDRYILFEQRHQRIHNVRRKITDKYKKWKRMANNWYIKDIHY